MKTAVLTLSMAALVHSSTVGLNAGDREWAVAGKVLTGVFAASVLSRAVEPVPARYYYPPQVVTVVRSAPAVCQPAPMVFMAAPQPICAGQPPAVYGPPNTMVYVAPPRFVYRSYQSAPFGIHRTHPGPLFHSHHRAHWGR